MSATLRGGRLARTRTDVVKFISSIDQDRRIARSVVLVNKAHVIALAKAHIIKPGDAKKLLGALQEIEKVLPYREGVEDVHVLVEDYVTKRVGEEVGGKLNTGKSRNDQVVTAIRMTLREALLELSGLILSFVEGLLKVAKTHKESLFVGYTHQQPAQPITFGHYVLAIGDAFLRDQKRVIETYGRVNACPMGSAALAGSSFEIDRSLVARLLGFDELVENSLDAVGSRDFVLDTLHACSSTALDLSRVAQDMILYSSAESGLVELPDEFASTSSIMPQKKNPDTLEVVRARCAKVMGNYSSAATTLHGLPTGYNLDYQEVTSLLWDSLNVTKSCLQIVIELFPMIKVDSSLRTKNQPGFIAATELANLLVRQMGIPFREAHRAVANAVRIALEKRQNLNELDREYWEKSLNRKLSEETFQRFQETMSLSKLVDQYKTVGSPNQASVEKMILDRARSVRIANKTNRALLARLRTVS